MLAIDLKTLTDWQGRLIRVHAKMLCVDCHFLSGTSWLTLAFWGCFERLGSSSSWGKATPSESCSGPLCSPLRFGFLDICLSQLPGLHKKSVSKLNHLTCCSAFFLFCMLCFFFLNTSAFTALVTVLCMTSAEMSDSHYMFGNHYKAWAGLIYYSWDFMFCCLSQSLVNWYV